MPIDNSDLGALCNICLACFERKTENLIAGGSIDMNNFQISHGRPPHPHADLGKGPMRRSSFSCNTKAVPPIAFLCCLVQGDVCVRVKPALLEISTGLLCA